MNNLVQKYRPQIKGTLSGWDRLVFRGYLKRRRSSQVSYRFRLLRAHGSIRKIPKHKRYQVSAKGRELITAIVQLQKTNLQQLKPLLAGNIVKRFHDLSG